MKTSFSIIGLDRSGISVALALAQREKDAAAIGWDSDPQKIKAAQSWNAFSALPTKLEEATKSVDLLLINQPLNLVQETFNQIKKWVRKDTLIIYFSSLPATVAVWAKQALPDSVHFIALTPSLNPKYLDDPDEQTPHADLFEHSRMFISHPAELPASIVQIADEVARLLGAEPCYAALEEVNGLQAITQQLPAISTLVLMDEVLHEPGWRDASQLAGAELVRALQRLDAIDPGNLSQILIANQENCSRVINNLQNSLSVLASLLMAKDNQKLQEKLSQLQAAYEDFLKKRKSTSLVKGSVLERN